MLIKCPECGKDISEKSFKCLYCGAEIESNDDNDYERITQPEILGSEYNESEVELNVILNIISFLIPLVGLILFAMWLDKMPQRAKSVGKSALIGFIVGIIVSVLVYTNLDVCAYCGKYGFGYKEESGLTYCDEHYLNALQDSIDSLQSEIDYLNSLE